MSGYNHPEWVGMLRFRQEKIILLLISEKFWKNLTKMKLTMNIVGNFLTDMVLHVELIMKVEL